MPQTAPGAWYFCETSCGTDEKKAENRFDILLQSSA